MDWFSWLFQTPLDPSLVYNYGVLFACNELTSNDIAYFDHEFLLSMGITIAKHRLEILKLARKKTKKSKYGVLKNFLNFLSGTSGRKGTHIAGVLGRGSSEMDAEKLKSSLSPTGVNFQEIPEEEMKVERFDAELKFSRSPAVMAVAGEMVARPGPLCLTKETGSSLLGRRKSKSGPINEGKPLIARSPMRSGPLDKRLENTRSPIAVGSLDECHKPETESHSPWATLYDDLKPN